MKQQKQAVKVLFVLIAIIVVAISAYVVTRPASDFTDVQSTIQ